MEPEGSSPYSQQPATCPYPDRSSLSPPQSNLLLPYHLRLGLPSGLLSSDFLTKAQYSPLLSAINATCPAHLNLLDQITRMILGEEYRVPVIIFPYYSPLHDACSWYKNEEDFNYILTLLTCNRKVPVRMPVGALFCLEFFVFSSVQPCKRRDSPKLGLFHPFASFTIRYLSSL
jgi:hypothetical protein